MGKYTNTAFKIILLILGIFDFLELLPDAIYIVNKGIVSILLVIFWYALHPTRFLFGTRKKPLDVAILIAFYLMSLQVFIRFIERFYSGAWIQVATQYALYAIMLSVLLIMGIAVYVTFKFEFERKSLLHSMIYFFRHKESFWQKFASPSKNIVMVLRFFIILITLYVMANYLFLRLNQWILVSLDKSFLFIAILYALKDIKGHKIDAVNKIGSFPEKLLSLISKLFTESNYAHLSFGFLLIFHYLSDLAIFFLPYLTPLPFNTQYYGLDPALHHSMWTHITAHAATNSISFLTIPWVYILSACGIMLLIILPILILFLEIFHIHIGEWQKKHFATMGVIVSTLCVFMYMLAPGITQIPMNITLAQAFGVDFITHSISPLFSFNTLFFLSIIFLALGYIIHLRFLKSFFACAIYLMSTTFLGLYCWNFILSASTYYTQVAKLFFNNGNILIAFHGGMLFVLTYIFYFGVFILFAYYTSKYLLRTLLYPLFHKWFAIVWSFFVLSISILLYNLWYTQSANFGLGLIISFLLTALFFTIAYVNVIKEAGIDMNFLSAANITTVAYGLTTLILVVIAFMLSFPPYFLKLLSPIFMCLLAAVLILKYNLKFPIFIPKIKLLIVSIVTGLIFGGLFWWIQEPLIDIGTKSMLGIVFFLTIVSLSEEMIFRYLILKTTIKATNFTIALIFQGVLFAMTHFIVVIDLWNHFGKNIIWLLGYFFLLVVFGIIMGLFMKKQNNVTYPAIAHLIANAVIYINLFPK